MNNEPIECDLRYLSVRRGHPPILPLRTHTSHLLPLWWRHLSGDPPSGLQFKEKKKFLITLVALFGYAHPFFWFCVPCMQWIAALHIRCQFSNWWNAWSWVGGGRVALWDAVIMTSFTFSQNYTTSVFWWEKQQSLFYLDHYSHLPASITLNMQYI